MMHINYEIENLEFFNQTVFTGHQCYKYEKDGKILNFFILEKTILKDYLEYEDSNCDHFYRIEEKEEGIFSLYWERSQDSGLGREQWLLREFDTEEKAIFVKLKNIAHDMSNTDRMGDATFYTMDLLRDYLELEEIEDYKNFDDMPYNTLQELEKDGYVRIL